MLRCLTLSFGILVIIATTYYYNVIIIIDSSSFTHAEKNKSYVELFLKEQVIGKTSSRNSTLKRHYYDSDPYINRLFDKTRSNIKSEIIRFNVSVRTNDVGLFNLKDLIMESGGRPVQIIIVSTWRSGTTFLGQLLNAIPGTYYHYEPLYMFGVQQIRGPPQAKKALSIIKNLLKCNYEGVKNYTVHMKRDYMKFIKLNTRIWEHCKFMTRLCDDAEFSSLLCKLFPFHAVKIVRLRLRLISEILADKNLNVKVILLVRDPRGVMQSRQHCDFCTPADCLNPSLVCADMISDYAAAGRIQQKYPDRLMVLRYEELALKPNTTSELILKFLRLNARSVGNFLRSHTNATLSGKWHTYRVSSAVPFRWKHELAFDYVQNVQMACKDAMRLWGYKMTHNETHMKSEDFYPIEDFKF